MLALCALLLVAAPCARAEDDVETAPGPAKGSAGTQGPRSDASPNGPAVSPAPGDVSEPEDQDWLSPPDADPHAQDSDETAAAEDDGSDEDAISGLPPLEGHGARAPDDDPYAVDPTDADLYDGDSDED